MKTFFVSLGVILAMIAWFTGAAILTVWVGATFGDEWKFATVTLGFAPVVAAIVTFIVDGT